MTGICLDSYHTLSYHPCFKEAQELTPCTVKAFLPLYQTELKSMYGSQVTASVV